MDELKFVLRCFGFAVLLMVLTQLKTGNVTIEHRLEASLLHTRTADFVNKVASGGVQLIRDVIVLGKSTYSDWRKPAAEAAPKEAVKSEQLSSVEETESPAEKALY